MEENWDSINIYEGDDQRERNDMDENIEEVVFQTESASVVVLRT